MGITARGNVYKRISCCNGDTCIAFPWGAGKLGRYKYRVYRVEPPTVSGTGCAAGL
jgi:hypothetical protein